MVLGIGGSGDRVIARNLAVVQAAVVDGALVEVVVSVAARDAGATRLAADTISELLGATVDDLLGNMIAERIDIYRSEAVIIGLSICNLQSNVYGIFFIEYGKTEAADPLVREPIQLAVGAGAHSYGREA